MVHPISYCCVWHLHYGSPGAAICVASRWMVTRTVGVSDWMTRGRRTNRGTVTRSESACDWVPSRIRLRIGYVKVIVIVM